MPSLLYRALLRLYPREFRARFGDEMLETANTLSHERGRTRLRAARDVVESALAVRSDLRRERRMARGHTGLLSDVRSAVRSLRKVPGFTVAAVLTLAFGIGAHAVVYAIVDAMLLRPLPFGDRSDRLVTLHSTHPTQATDWDDSELSYADLLDLRDGASAFTAIEGILNRNFSVAATDDAARVIGASITPGLFPMLGVAPALGRHFRDDDGAEPGFEQVVMLSHTLWTRLFAADPSIIGRPVLINARPVTVIGVMPAGFLFPEQHQLWVPYAADRTVGRANRSILGVGLLATETTIGQAAADLDRVAATLATAHPDTNRGWGVHVLTLREFQVGDGRGLSAMLGAVSLLLLVACANVAGLLIARGVSRERELITRAALGASRGRLVRLLLTEAIVVATVGGILGTGLAMWGLAAVLGSVAELPAYWTEPRIDLRVLASTALVTAVVSLMAGLVPALRLSKVDLSAAGSGTRSVGASRGHRRFQRGLVIAQVSVSFVLLVGATLLARSAVALQQADPGFEAANMLSGRFYIAGDAYDPPEARAAAVDRVVQAIAAIPGVTSASATMSIPADDGGQTILVRPTGAMAATDDAIGVMAISMTSGLWDTLGLSLREGRTLSTAEVLDPMSTSVLVNDRLAQQFWPGQSAVDRTLQTVNARGVVTNSWRVVGVTPNLVYEEFGETTPQAELNVYLPYGRSGGRTLAVLARTSGTPASYSEALRAAVRSVDPSFATFDVLSMTERRRLTTWSERFLAGTFSGFAVAALVLACLGTYGLVAYAAAQRRREVGVRLAIGATRTDIVSLFVRGGGMLGLLGIAIGLPLAMVVARGLSEAGMLFGVSPWDVRVWVALPCALIAAVLLATTQPAFKASRVDPSDALRD
jgi:predicted permease